MIRAAILCLLPLPAAAIDFEFCWEGANGHVLSGRMIVTPEAMEKPLITEADVVFFQISGTQFGGPTGFWSLDDLTPETSWNLNFDPRTETFLTGGLSSSDNGQQWNASGAVNDCGSPGFGFNSGAAGQDVCIDGVYRTDSTIPEATPFRAFPTGQMLVCSQAPSLSGWIEPPAPRG